MLATTLLWSYIFCITLVYGLIGIIFFQKLALQESSQPVSLPLASILGLILLTTASTYLSLVIKIGRTANILFIAGAVIFVVWQRKIYTQYLVEKWKEYRRTNPLVWILVAAAFVAILARSVEPPHDYDTGLYHAQAIRWVEQYRVIPGLGNLHFRLAYDSSFFISSALFSMSFLGLGSFHTLGSFITFLGCAYSLGKLDSLLQNKISLSNITALFVIFLPFRFFSVLFSSPQPDIPAAVLTWLIFLISLEKIEKRESDLFDISFLIICLFTTFVITIKVSILTIIILPLFFFIYILRSTRPFKILLIPAMVLVILSPWLIRNIILSGYLIYPFPALDLFHFDWKIPKEVAQFDIDWIKSYARIPREDKNVVLAMPFSDWIKRWYVWQNKPSRQLYYLIAAGFPFLLAVTAIRTRSQKDRFRENLGSLVLYLTAIAGLIYWFIQAPSFRFGIGFIGIFACLVAAPLLKWLITSLPILQKPLWILLAIALLVIQGAQAIQMRQFTRFSEVVVFPSDYQVPPVQKIKLENIKVAKPTMGDQCYYQPFPCSPMPFGVQQRGSHITDGFRYQP